MRLNLTQNFTAITLIVLACVASSLGDMLMQQLSHTICPYHILTLKYGITLIGAILIQRYHFNQPLNLNLTSQSRMRGILLFGAISLWSYGLRETSLPTATALSFCGPVITLGLAHLYLKEHVQLREVIPLLICLIGVMIFVGPLEKLSVSSLINLSGATLLFALIDCMNKNLTQVESPLQATISIAMVCTVLSLLSGAMFPLTMRLQDMSILMLMGGCNLVLIYAMIAAYKLACLKTLLPWKYSELLISVILAIIFLGCTPTIRMITGIAIIGVTQIYVLATRDRHMVSIALC